MRFAIKTNKWCEDDLSAASSLASVESNYEIFGSACSDFSECEREENRKHRTGKRNLNGSTLGSIQSLRSTMERAETVPLLGTPVQPVYKSYQKNDSLSPGDISPSKIITSYKLFEKPTKPERRKQSSLVTIFSVWNTIMGSSLLTMAWGVERAGLPVALLLVALMAALCLYTAYVLLRVNAHHGSDTCEVPALCRALLGRWAELLAHAFSLLVLLGANVVYWILITNFLYFTVNYFMDVNASNGTLYNSTVLCPKLDGLNGSLLVPDAAASASPYWGLHTTVPVYVAFIVFPLLNFKNVSFFTKFNSLGTLSVAYLVIFVVVKGWGWGAHWAGAGGGGAAGSAAVLSGMLALSFYIHNIVVCYHPVTALFTCFTTLFICFTALFILFHGTLSVAYLVIFVMVKGWGWGAHWAGAGAGGAAGSAAVLSGMLALSFYIHNIIITIMSNNARQDKNGRDLTIAFVLVTLTYMLVGAGFYICFPLAKACIEDNILNNFEMHDIMTAVARMLLLFQVVTVYPLVAFMLRSEAILLMGGGGGTWRTVTINLAIITVCILVACFCPSIGTIIRYTGAVSGLVHVFALPAMLQVRSLQLRGKLTAVQALLHAAIALFGAGNLLMQFFI